MRHVEMKIAYTSIALALASSVVGCSTAMPTKQSGFLSSYLSLTPGADKATHNLRTTVAIDPSRISMGEIEWRVQPNSNISREEQAALLAQLKEGLQQRVHELPAAPNGRPTKLRAAITRVETVSPSLNTIVALLMVVPLDRGGAAVEIEAVDAESGKQLAALRLGYFAPLSELRARFSKLAPAEIAVRKAAEEFAALLQPVGTRKSETQSQRPAMAPTYISNRHTTPQRVRAVVAS